MQNYELFLNDPRSFTIPNDGVTTIGTPRSEQEWDVVRYELRSFVCEGEYRKGLERILSTFLSNLDQPKQPAAWVSGFYGSGKSHFVRVLEYIWRDMEFSDGAKARSLVNLPTEIKDLLIELSTAGKRHGGLWSAAGTLSSSASGSVRLALLSIVFRSAGLPDAYEQARFILWLRQKGFYQTVVDYMGEQGTSLSEELHHMYVSPEIADGLLTAYPDFASNPKEARSLIKAQFPEKNDISDDELITTLEHVLELQQETTGRLPLTLIIFDELQQFIGDDQQRTTHVQEVVQACSSRFGSRLLFIGTGQASLRSNPLLSKLQGRFTVQVVLEDSDVERVVRQVVLRKNSEKITALKSAIESVRGEIDRHLAGTTIGPAAEDTQVLIPDYPLLPTRRRFWERTLRAIDPGGTLGQLRTQLRVVHEANRMVANRPLGNVVPTDVIYDQQQTSMLQSAVLPRELDNTIQGMDDGSQDGVLRTRLCKLIFLVGKLPTEGSNVTGLRATADVLADLLVADLNAGSTSLRQRIPGLLQGLVEKGVLLPIGQEYRLQTAESAEWEADFRKRLASIRADEARIASERSDEIQKAIKTTVKGITLTQGVSKTPRKFQLHFGQDVPRVDNGEIPVWVQDEWMASEKSVRESAQQSGVDSPVVFVLLPRRDADSLREAIVTFHAANDTLSTRPNPTTSGGYEARQGMEFRRDGARIELTRLINGLLNKARIFQGGGHEINDNDFSAAVKTALEASLIRMFPKFEMADHASWGKVVVKAREGAPDALRYVDFQGNPEQHPVCQEILRFVGANKKGNEIRKTFMGNQYGWPQDAVDGVLFTLVGAGALIVDVNRQPKTVKELDKTQINTAEFHAQTVTITAVQRIQLRSLLAELEIKSKTGDEGEAIPALLQKLLMMAERVGGLAPLPERPSIAKLDELQSLIGNEQFAAVVESREVLKSYFKEWAAAETKKNERVSRWQMVQQLQNHARALPVAADVKPQVEAVQSNRLLLEDPDPLKPLLDTLVDTLRTEVQTAYQRYQETFKQEIAALTKSASWKALKEEQQPMILLHGGLNAQVAQPQVGSPEALLASLNTSPLDAWINRTAALPALAERARLEAARLLEPEAVRVKLPSATIKTQADLDAYLKKLEAEIKIHLDDGKPVVL